MTFRSVFLFFAALLAVAPADAQVPLRAEHITPVIVRRDDLPRATIESDALASPFDCVGIVSSGVGFGSGTLISSRVVLTAGHVVGATPSGTYRFGVGGADYFTTNVLLHPNYVSFDSSVQSGNDIALLIFDTDITGITPATLNTNTNELGTVGVNVGYGYRGIGSLGQGRGVGGESEPFGVKAAGSNTVDRFGDFYSNVSSKFMLQDFDNPLDPSTNRMGSASALDKECLIGQGDSGGGLFQDFGNGYVLSGVHSFLDDFGTGDGILANYGDVAGSVRVSQQLDFIRGGLASTPEPGSLWLICCAAPAIACAVVRRRRA